MAREEPLVVVKAPPGSGKTKLIVDAAALLRSRDAQSRSRRRRTARRTTSAAGWPAEFPFTVTRFYGSVERRRRDLGREVEWVDKKDDLPEGPSIVVEHDGEVGSDRPGRAVRLAAWWTRHGRWRRPISCFSTRSRRDS